MEPTAQTGTTELLRRKRRFWKAAIWISAIGVAVPPVVGLGGTIFGMMGAFNKLEDPGSADPAMLAQDIQLAGMTTMISLSVSLCFLFALAISLIKFYRLPKPGSFSA